MKTVNFSNSYQSQDKKYKIRPYTAHLSSFRRAKESTQKNYTSVNLYTMSEKLSQPKYYNNDKSVLLNATLNNKFKMNQRRVSQANNCHLKSFRKEQFRKNSLVSKQNSENSNKNLNAPIRVECGSRNREAGKFVKTKTVMVWQIPQEQKQKINEKVAIQNVIRYENKRTQFYYPKKKNQKIKEQKKDDFKITSWENTEQIELNDLILKNWGF